MGSAEAIIELFALIAAVIFGYFQIIVPFLKGEVKITRQWPFVEDVSVVSDQESMSQVGDERKSETGKREGERVAHVLFVDMVGYIPMTLEDDALAQELLQEYVRLLRSISGKHGGTELKVYGDEFLIEFPTSEPAERRGIR
jgi:class 3 adenylate cyclase